MLKLPELKSERRHRHYEVAADKVKELLMITMVRFFAVLLIFAFAAGVSAQDQALITEAEKQEVQAFAKRFVGRFLQTRDVRPLLAEYFLNDFTALHKQDFYEKVAPELYAKLSKNERVRLFVAQENLGYLITLDVMTQPDSQPINRLPFERLLPAAIARKLNRERLVEGTAKFTKRRELLQELSRLEKALLEARPFVKRKNLEQSPEFLKELGIFERDAQLGYRVRGSLVDEELRREPGFARFAVGQKVLSINTPILIELIVVKDAGKLRIITMVPADDD
jgi:hypothetical protein